MTADLGRLGESVMQAWAAQAGLILNRSTDHDAAGWDCLVEWPLAPAGPDVATALTLPLDRRPAPRQCLVQVKATVGRRNSWAVKLSNWLRLVRAPLPCFFAVLEFDKDALTLRRAFLVHVGAAHTHAVLKRVRELEAGRGRTASKQRKQPKRQKPRQPRRQPQRHPELHKHTLALTWTPADALAPLSGAGFRQRVETDVGPDVEAYARRKLAVAARVGYEHGGLRVDADVTPPAGWRGDARDLMLDFQLGLVSHLDVRRAEVFDTRFEIPLRDPAGPRTGGRLVSAGVAPAARAQGRFRVPGTPEVRLEFDVRVATDGPPDAAAGGEPRVKARFSAPFLDFVLHPDGRRMDVRVQPPGVRTSHPLAALYPAAAYLGVLDAAHRTGTTVAAEFRVEGELAGTGEIAQPTPVAHPLGDWGDLVRRAWLVAKDADLPPDLAVRVADLAPSLGPLQLIAAVLRPTESPLTVEVTIADPVPEPDRVWCFPVAAAAKIGPYVIQVAAGLFGHPSVVDTRDDGAPRYRLETTDMRVRERRVYRDPEVPEHTVEQLQREVATAYQGGMNVVLVTDAAGRYASSSLAPPLTE